LLISVSFELWAKSAFFDVFFHPLTGNADLATALGAGAR
jgi:hypothetical protein